MILLTKLGTKNFENSKQINCFLINIGLSFIKLTYMLYLDFLLKTKLSLRNHDIILKLFSLYIYVIFIFILAFALYRGLK